MSSKPLALITAFGGINSAGRSSAHLSYKNLVFNSISEKEQLVFLSRVGIYKHKALESVRFKEVSGGLLGVFLNISDSGDVFDLLSDFVHLFDPIDTA